MPPPPWPSASAMATRLATHWVADFLAGDESIDFSVLQALLRASSERLAGGPEATRERLALRSLQEVSSLIPAGGDAAATAGVVRADSARSCEDALARIVREVEVSGKLEKDLLPPYSQGIQETIRTKKFALPETSFQLLKGVDPWITSMTPQSQLEHNGTSVLHQPCTPKSGSYVPPQEVTMDTVGLGARSPERSPIVERSMSGGSVLASAGCDAPLPTDASEPGHLPECITAQDTTMISLPESRKAYLSALQHKGCEKVNQDQEDVSASIWPVEKDHVHGDVTLQSASVLLPISCNGANQGSKSETNLQPGTSTEDRMAFEVQNAYTSCLEVSGADTANRALHDDGSIMKNDTALGGLTAQTAPVSQNCKVTLHDKTSEANYFSEQKNEKNGTDVQKDNCRTSIPSSSKGRDGESAKKTSNEEKSEDTSPEISVCFKDQDISDFLERWSQQVLCTKCGEDGELLTCSDCSLAAHDSCFGPSVTFEDPDLFYCPVCSFKKAREAYLKAEKAYFEAMKNAASYIGTAQVSKQLNGVQPGAAKRDGHSNGSDMSKRNSIHQNESYDLAHRDEEPHQQRKKQKINARGNCYLKEVLTEKVPFQNSGPAPMNKHSVLQNNSKTRVEVPEKKQQTGDKEAGNDNSSHETTASSQRVCDPPLNQDDKDGQENYLAASNQSGGKRSSAPWRNETQQKKIARKKSSVHQRKRYSNPVGPIRRRKNLVWTEEEEAMLREAMANVTQQNDAKMPWTQILEYGSNVFHKTRLPMDLRDKWRNINK